MWMGEKGIIKKSSLSFDIDAVDAVDAVSVQGTMTSYIISS